MTFTPERPPLFFNTPPGWPQPSPAWIARNQAWRPPTGWLPPVAPQSAQPGVQLSPAPQTWHFWGPDPVSWQVFRAPYAKQAHRAVLIGALMFGLGTIITIAGYLGDLGSTFLVLWGLIIFGAIRLVSGLINLKKVDAIAQAALPAHTRAMRRQLDESAYPVYLSQTAAERAETGRPAMSIDEFQVARDAEPWSFQTTPGSWADSRPAI